MKVFNGTTWARNKGVAVDNWERKMELMKKQLKGKIVLDAGSGLGGKTKFFAKETKQIYGLEISKNDVEIAKSKNNNKNVQFRVGNVEQMPYNDSFFDVVYSCWVIEHLENPKIFLEECFRVLKPRGILILWVPNIKNLTGIMIKLISLKLKTRMLSLLSKKPEKNVSHHICHYRANSVKKLDKLLKEKFNRIFLERHDGPVYYEKYKSLTYLWYIRHKFTKNKFLDWLWPSFYVEYQKK